ncbi:MAG: ATP-dependent DNA helicase [Rhizomicrobium sp.]
MPPETVLSDLIALVPAPPGAAVSNEQGVCRRVDLPEARQIFRSGKVLLAHAPFVAGRLKTHGECPPFDLLELFVFLHPGQPLIPSPLGLARALGLDLPASPEASARILFPAGRQLLAEARTLPPEMKAQLAPLVSTMSRSGWPWGPFMQQAFGPATPGTPIAGMESWRGLTPWEDEAPTGTPGSAPVSPEEARRRLFSAVETPRPEQPAFSDAATYAFGPRQEKGSPRIALVEAGTGTGKTLAYLAPASIWAEKNGPGLWISTYTRNLQRQIEQEIARYYPDPQERKERAVIRKGRENYLCLLNFEEAARRTALGGGSRAIALGLIARWIASPTDGDISGAGFPAFLAALLPLGEITDRRGECIYAACPHYRVCFIERAIRRARRAPIVIANHALVIALAAGDSFSDQTGDAPDGKRLRYVFDEGHHLFDAADSGFAARLSGREMAELRRWIRGPEGRARTRMRGLEERLKDLVARDEEALAAIEEAVNAAGGLAGEGWMARATGAAARGAGEIFLAQLYLHVRGRSDDRDSFYTLEAEPYPLNDDLAEAVRDLRRVLGRIADPLTRLAKLMRRAMDEKNAMLEPSTRGRLEAAARGLERRARTILPQWTEMLDNLESGEVNEEFADWFEISREEGKDADIAFERRWVDPTMPFAAEILEPAHGALITSATLRDGGVTEEDWLSAEVRTGVLHLPGPARRTSFGSPFRYQDQARVFVVGDVARRDAQHLASAMRDLFKASGGGALGLFTSVRSLKETWARIAGPLADCGLALYAQHVDRLDTGALVDLFRAEENACLLGTDALRDGVDVPGRSLRLVVFDKVPWPKPTILHKARRARFGRSYDDLLTRLRLKQAFGRLVRGPEDRGCFVILEGATPSRLLGAFPQATPVKRCGLKEAIGDIRDFLGQQTPLPPP